MATLYRALGSLRCPAVGRLAARPLSRTLAALGDDLGEMSTFPGAQSRFTKKVGTVCYVRGWAGDVCSFVSGPHLAQHCFGRLCAKVSLLQDHGPVRDHYQSRRGSQGWPEPLCTLCGLLVTRIRKAVATRLERVSHCVVSSSPCRRFPRRRCSSGTPT